MLSSEKPAENAPSDSTSPNITRELAVGSGWMIGAQLVIQAIGLLSTIILARLLIPADFGLVALAITIFAGLQALSDLSFDVPLIQNPRAGRAEYDFGMDTIRVSRYPDRDRAHRRSGTDRLRI